MAGKKVLHQRNRPLLEGFGKHCVVGVTEGLLNNCVALVKDQNLRLVLLTAPGIVPVQALNIDQYPLKLGNSQCRVSIVELNGDLVRKLAPSALALLESANNVVE
jgi:hypothetical protein